MMKGILLIVIRNIDDYDIDYALTIYDYEYAFSFFWWVSYYVYDDTDKRGPAVGTWYDDEDALRIFVMNIMMNYVDYDYYMHMIVI